MKPVRGPALCCKVQGIRPVKQRLLDTRRIAGRGRRIKGKGIMRIKCYCDLYVSGGLKRKKNKILKKLMERIPQPSVYVLTLAQGEQNQLEFYPALLLKQPWYDDADIFVVGIADGYDAAVDLVEEIVREVQKETGDTDIRGFLAGRQERFEEGLA